jgi:rhodanese-related sulfurtransferase
MKHLLLTTLFFFFISLLTATAADYQVMTKEELREQLNSPELIIIDARSRSQWDASKFKIPGAAWMPSERIDLWADKLPRNKKVVIYCACMGLGASGRLAGQLVSEGFQRVYALQGGWNGWQEGSYPLEEK